MPAAHQSLAREVSVEGLCKPRPNAGGEGTEPILMGRISAYCPESRRRSQNKQSRGVDDSNSNRP